MANQWLRLWHDMPNDPKWRTVARVSKQPISVVLAVYVHLLVDASQNVTRGHVSVTLEDLASALDVDEEAVQAVIDAMQGRLLDGMYLLGWEKRQPKREDAGDQETGAKTAAQRKADQRAREKAARELLLSQANVTNGHDVSRNVTTDKEKEEDKDTDKDFKTLTDADASVAASDAGDEHGAAPIKVAKPSCPHQDIIAIYHEVLPMCPQVRDWTPARQEQLRARWNEDPSRQNLAYWRRYFEYVKTCGFLVGIQPNTQRRPFFADLEWLTKQANFTKVRERKYES